MRTAAQADLRAAQANLRRARVSTTGASPAHLHLRDEPRHREADWLALQRELRAARRRTARAVEAERRRLERDLHDGAQQRLIALRIRLGLAAEIVTREPETSSHMLSELAQEAQDALEELRSLVHGAPPALLADHGLAHALEAAGRGLPASLRIEADEIDRYDSKLEAAVYFTCLEALQNAVKHAGPGATVTVHLREHSERLHFAVRDTGRGFDASGERTTGGLVNMRERIDGVGGELEIHSWLAQGTSIVGSVPTRVRT
jgi:signal transduction histidine kinase